MKTSQKKFQQLKRDQARSLGLQAWANRHSQSCPYEPGSELAAIWQEAKDEARRLNERPEAPREEPMQIDSVVEVLNRHFRGES